MMRPLALLMFLAVLTLTSCKNKSEEVPEPQKQSLSIRLSFECDGKAIVKDVFDYTNDAGNNYSISRLQFYLADFKFEKPDGSELKSETVVYVDFFAGKGLEFSLPNIPGGDYRKISFCIGLPPSQNITGALPNTIDNVNMAWPDMMGGGYHFLKMEGNFKFSGNTYGYAIHLGKNPHLVRITAVQNFSFSTDAPVLHMKMNINEWFRTPHTYDLNTDGNYTMGTDSLMMKIAENGTDVFTLW
jgi:hypothetical protein